MDLKSSLPFTKMHGSGNDFVVLQANDISIADADLPEFTRQVCRRGMSVGADGVIVISPSDKADFHWRYINADGSDGEMCGNGAMVGARYAVDHGLAPAECTFETSVGEVRASVDGSRVSLGMIDTAWLGDGLEFDAFAGVEFDHLLIGVPHVVGFVEVADAVTDLHGIGKAIRNDAQLQPAGANVNLVHKIDGHTIRMRTYERGVEAETLACGTGAVCSAIAAGRRGLVQQPVNVRVSSGMDLTVTWQSDGARFTGIELTGNARVVARGKVTGEALQGP